MLWNQRNEEVVHLSFQNQRGVFVVRPGAAALTMAWFRPDLYHRVLSYSGTFVNLRNSPEAPLGAYEYIEHLFPAGEKKPFRIWIQVSENDNGAKSASEGRRNWVIANSRFAKVLKDKDLSQYSIPSSLDVFILPM